MPTFADLNFLANATFDVHLAPTADAIVPDKVREGALPPYCASYLLSSAMGHALTHGMGPY